MLKRTILLALFLGGCGAHHTQLVCGLITNNGNPGLGCEEYNPKIHNVRPYQPTPPPAKPQLGPYWKYDGRDKT